MMRSKKRKDLIFYCGILAIPLIQFCIMYIGVNFNSILLSFKKYDANHDYVWSLDNFVEVINDFRLDQYLQDSMLNTVMLFALITLVSIPTSLFISFYFYKKFAFSRVMQVIMFIPSIISGVVTITCFYYLADYGWPLLVKLITGKEGAMGLLVNSETRTPTLVFYNLFYSLAGNFLFYSSAMGGIDTSVSEAAQIDGANLRQEFFHVTLPMIYPTLSTFIIGSFAGSLIGDYGMYAFSKTSGGAAIPTMGYYFTSGIMNDTEQLQYPYYAALGLVLTVVTCIVVFSVRAIMNRLDPFRDKKTKR